MRNKILSLLGIVGLSAAFVGCSTFRPPVSGDPAEELEYKQKIERTALLLKNATYSALILVVDKNPEERDAVVNYARLVVTAVNTILYSNQTSPQDLDLALSAIPVKELKSAEAKIAAPLIISLYLVWHGELTSKWFGSDKLYVANTLLTGILEGAQHAVEVLE